MFVKFLLIVLPKWLKFPKFFVDYSFASHTMSCTNWQLKWYYLQSVLVHLLYLLASITRVFGHEGMWVGNESTPSGIINSKFVRIQNKVPKVPAQEEG